MLLLLSVHAHAPGLDEATQKTGPRMDDTDILQQNQHCEHPWCGPQACTFWQPYSSRSDAQWQQDQPCPEQARDHRYRL
jgi:hypothetical protein